MEKMLCFAKVGYTSHGILSVKGSSTEIKDCVCQGIDHDEVLFREETGYLDSILNSIIESDEEFIVEVDPYLHIATEVITGRKFPLVIEGNRYRFRYGDISCEKETQLTSKSYPVSSFFVIHLVELDNQFFYPIADPFDLKDYILNNNARYLHHVLDEYELCGDSFYHVISDYLHMNRREFAKDYDADVRVRKRNAN